jgi:hypothetical protein
MSAFDEREKAFEAKYHMDEEIAFRVNAKRIHLFASWAAEQLGMSGSKSEDYVRELLNADLDRPGHKGLIAKVKQDFEAAKTPIAEEDLLRHLDRMVVEAKKQVMSEVSGA